MRKPASLKGKTVMNLARQIQVEAQETLFSREAVHKRQEAFLTATVTGVLGIVSINSTPPPDIKH